MNTVAINRYQISKLGKGTKKVKGIKTIISSIEVIPIKDKGLPLDFIIALQIAWHTAENKIIINIRFMDNCLIFLYFLIAYG